MLFNDKLLSKVQMFSSEEWLGANTGTAPYDEVKVVFEGPKSFLGIKYWSTWTEKFRFKYTFTKRENNTNKYKANPDFEELTNQLSNFLSKQHIEISRENYEYFIDKYPERFI